MISIQDNPHNPVRTGGYGGSEGTFTLTGLSKPEVEAMQGAILGANWIRVHEGRMAIAHAYEQSPPPAKDPDIGPFWPRPDACKYTRKDHKVQMFDHADPGFSEAALIVKHIGAGCPRTDEDAYDRNARLLESWGFECLRSRRGSDGKFWEVWYLPSLFFAEGDLGARLANVKGKYGSPTYQKDRLDAAMRVVEQHVNFDQMDASNQRYGLRYGD